MIYGSVTDAELKALLLETELVSLEDLSLAEKRAREKGEPLAQSVLWYGFLSDEEVGRLLADLRHIPFIVLGNLVIPEDILSIIPEVVARKQRAIAFREDSEGIHVATTDPWSDQFFDFLERKSGRPVKVFLTTDRDISDAITSYTKDVAGTIGKLLSAPGAIPGGETEGEGQIISLVDELIRHAHENRASDIHIEPSGEESVVRFRIDGLLHDIIRLPKDIHTQVVARIKVLAQLRMDEHSVPQDGKIQLPFEGGTLDVRVSLVPVTDGEKAVLRLLSERSRQFSIETLGFSSSDLEKIRSAYKKPYGCILSTGPTGCGKTTTLYAVLKLLNHREVNVMTIEDPVEYDMEGVNQIQVNAETDLTFANGLRSILRQDPNVILVGEIRDPETAEIAMQLALTGHLVLSTLHTNDAATTLPRLSEMGIEPFVIASTVNLIIAQRLVRKTHALCRMSEEVPVEKVREAVGEELFMRVFGSEEEKTSVRLYRGKGCPLCHGTGYEGRIGIFEVLTIDDAVQDVILKQGNAVALREAALASGMHSMFEDGLEKAKQGITTLEEVLRVTRE